MSNETACRPRIPTAARVLRRARDAALATLATFATLAMLIAVTGFGPATAQPVIAAPGMGALPAPPKLSPMPPEAGTKLSRQILVSQGRLRGLYPWDCVGAACGTVPQPNNVEGMLSVAKAPRFKNCIMQCTTHSSQYACIYACGNAAGLSDAQIDGKSYVSMRR